MVTQTLSQKIRLVPLYVSITNPAASGGQKTQIHTNKRWILSLLLTETFGGIDCVIWNKVCVGVYKDYLYAL
jgi:hypothetical protein